MDDNIVTQAVSQAKANYEELIRLRIVNATLHDEIERLEDAKVIRDLKIAKRDKSIEAQQAEIERLRAALALAVGELSTHEHWGEFDHHEVVAHFLEEARRG